jgi:hypothetical protein
MNEKVKHFTALMLTRRGYKVPSMTQKLDAKNISPEFYIAESIPCFKKNKNRSNKTIVFFITKNNINSEKLTINIYKQLLVIASEKNYNTIVVYDSQISLTSDVKTNIENCANNITKVHIIEVFNSDRLGFDLYETLFENKDHPDNIVFCEDINDKIPVFCINDVLVQYIGAFPGDVLRGKFQGDHTVSERRVSTIVGLQNVKI